ncbi:MAG: hypothetical protein PUI54_03105 [Bacteroidales bacterium]|nr:hypothetical protein [Bacteroidales bacterium]MDY2934876.1 hypothetical protein [Candidatus Cryptobacteroides sp.]
MDDQIKKKFEEFTNKWAKLDEAKSLSIKNKVSEYENTASLSNLLKSFEDSFCAALKEEESTALSNCILVAYEKAVGSLNEKELALLTQFLSHPINAEKQRNRLEFLLKQCTTECING